MTVKYNVSQRAPIWLLVVAGSFVAYFGLLVASDLRGPEPLGMVTDFSGGRKTIRAVLVGSAAERAGLAVGDRIVAVDGHGIRNLFDWTPIRVNFEVGRPSTFEIERGERRFTTTVRLERASWNDWTSREGLLTLAMRAAQLCTLALALFVALSRPRDLQARVGAWLLATTATISLLLPYGLAVTWRRLPGLVGVLLWIPLSSTLAAGPLALTFFALFPRRLFRSRAAWAAVWAPVVVSAPVLARYFHHMIYDPWSAAPIPSSVLSAFHAAIPIYGAAGVVALVVNYRRLDDADARRRVRVLVVGSAIGWTSALPLFLYWWAPASRLAPAFFFSPAMVLSIVLFLAFPASFAYAIVRHRVLEIPVLLRRSARYVLVQRGVVTLAALAGLAATAAFAVLFGRLAGPYRERGLEVGLAAGAALGGALAWGAAHAVRRVTRRIDRAFFRSVYDSRRTLEDLAARALETSSREQLAALLARHVDDALHPASLAVYLESSDGRLALVRGEAVIESLAAGAAAIAEIDDWRPERALPAALAPLAELEPDAIVPVPGRDRRVAGLLVLGERLSDEPYSGEDRRLLAAAASAVGMALENVRLAERMAERLDAERRAARELEIAREVQAKLFPQKKPRLRTLEYDGCCVQAREVGGDYYDFLDLGPGRLALVLADISGKGISAALLMANLQANLRSQYGRAIDDLPALLGDVNRLFFESTSPERYATAVFATYDDAARRLRYVNCGHVPPIVIRAAGEIARLEANATVLGLFEDWSCTVEEITLEPGDLVAFCSDGATEAHNPDDEELGDARLVAALQARRHLPIDELLDAVVETIRRWSAAAQGDDLTLLVARAV